LIKQKSIRSKRCPLLKIKLYSDTINIRYLLFVTRCSLFDVRFSLFVIQKTIYKSASKTDLFYFLYTFKRYETAECPKRTERSISVQWTFIANGPACARCLDTIVKYLVEFKKNKSESWFFEYFLIKQKSIRSKRCSLLKIKLNFDTINIRCSLFVIRYSLFKKRFIKSKSKTDLFYFFL
jgi:hypothetical protein